MKVPYVEPDLCTGCETCVSLCPEVFTMQGDKSVVTSPDKCGTCDVQEAIDTCPVEAIKWAS
ncbi:MAG: ferredoxin [Nitrospirae bacterium]|nr:ferredoxin [Nitrospirota bacterium]